jgi:Response regulator containing a CheY-like receiver domain and an HTH DNA-binding domain
MTITDNISLFFNENISYPQAPDYSLPDLRFQNLQAVSNYVKKTFFLTDLYKKQFIIFNFDPKLSNVFGEAGHTLTMDENSITEKILGTFKETLTQYVQIITTHIIQQAKGEDNTFYFSFNAPFITLDNQIRTLSIKAFAYFYSSYQNEKLPWINFYQIDSCEFSCPGQLTLHNINAKSKTLYILCPKSTETLKYTTLKPSDLEIFTLACQGFSEAEIATQLSISTSTLKRTKATIMAHLSTQSTAQTVAILHQQGFI